MFYIYILQSERDRKLYIGQTSNLESRLYRHNTGQVNATRNRKPMKLLCSREFKTRAEAMRMERHLKSLKGNDKFRETLYQWGVAKW